MCNAYAFAGCSEERSFEERPILKRPFIAAVSFHSCFGHEKTRIGSSVTVKKIVCPRESTFIV